MDSNRMLYGWPQFPQVHKEYWVSVLRANEYFYQYRLGLQWASE